MTLAPSILVRFWSKVKITNSCWYWTASCFRDGYGQFKIKYKNTKAHRIAYSIINGPIAVGMLVCHSCDNPRCVNPDHLFLGTQADNSRDRNIKNRQVKGQRINTAKLKVEDVLAIRLLYASGTWTQESLSKQFKIDQTGISRIVLRQTWKSV